MSLLTQTTIVMLFELVPSLKGMVGGSTIPAFVVTSIIMIKVSYFTSKAYQQVQEVYGKKNNQLA